MISQKSLARIIEADLLCDQPKPAHRAVGCLTCGRSFLYKAGRFCSGRCRESFDTGARAWDEPREKNLHLWTPPLQDWRAVAGPPGTVGLNPWQGIIDASVRKRVKLEKRKNRQNRTVHSRAYKGGDLRIGPTPIRERTH